ncbi:uncharacterized protein [Asterias amurensis]|uniref:uncharacterized protein n=1 Tax=Asterias amurensis TaxID=7602 RepID=UPI003AB50174
MMISLAFMFAASILFLCQCDAMVCSISQEHDPSAGNIYRWVVPVEDPCRCTEIRMGGMNTRTPCRNFKVIYFDIPMSTADEVHNLLNCSGEPVTKSTSLTSSHYSASLTTEVNCADAGDGQYFADHSDCTKYYRCILGDLIHESCTDGLTFNPDYFACDYSDNVLCADFNDGYGQ